MLHKVNGLRHKYFYHKINLYCPSSISPQRWASHCDVCMFFYKGENSGIHLLLWGLLHGWPVQAVTKMQRTSNRGWTMI